MKTVEEEDLLPGEIKLHNEIGRYDSEHVELEHCFRLNQRKINKEFVERVTKKWALLTQDL